MKNNEKSISTIMETVDSRKGELVEFMLLSMKDLSREEKKFVGMHVQDIIKETYFKNKAEMEKNAWRNPKSPFGRIVNDKVKARGLFATVIFIFKSIEITYKSAPQMLGKY